MDEIQSKPKGKWLQFFQFSARCLGVAVSLTVFDVVFALLAPNEEPPLRGRTFLAAFSSTLAVYLASTFALWCVIWMFAVMIGRVRARTAFVFVALTLGIFVLSVDLLDMSLGHVLNEFPEFSPFVTFIMGSSAVVLAAVVTTITSRFIGDESSLASVKAMDACTLGVLAEILLVALPAQGSLPGTIAIPIVIALTFGLLYFFLVRSKRVSMLLNGAIVLSALLYLPYSIQRQSTGQTATNFAPLQHDVRHVVLITIDTLRRDAVTTYDTAHGVTSEIDRVAKDGVVFENAFASAPWTLPSLASIMTGLPYAVHGAVTPRSAIPTTLKTLAEVMSENGYRTVGIGNNFFATPRTNLNQGFQEYQWYPMPLFKTTSFPVGLAARVWSTPLVVPASTRKLTDSAISWIRTHQEEDFFLWLHYFDPHIPYDPPAAYRNAVSANTNALINAARIRAGFGAHTRKERDEIGALYDGEVRYVDANIGRVLNALQECGIYDGALIVVTSDHGEEHWEHNGFEHGHALYNEVIRVPLIVKKPALDGGKREPAYVGTTSVASTVFELCGIQIDSRIPLSPSLAPLLSDKMAPFDQQPLFAGGLLYFGEKSCAIFDGWKLIQDDLTGRYELFNLREDPLELTSLAGLETAVVQQGKQLIEGRRKDAEAARLGLGLTTDQTQGLAPQEIETLNSVGYL